MLIKVVFSKLWLYINDDFMIITLEFASFIYLYLASINYLVNLCAFDICLYVFVVVEFFDLKSGNPVKFSSAKF